jgi:hypothetical protein
MTPEAGAVWQSCVMASSSLSSPCARSWDRSNRTYGSFELSDNSFLQMSWNPSNDQAVLVPFGELYALTHTIQRIDAHAPRGSVTLFGAIHALSLGQQRWRVQGRVRSVEGDEGASVRTLLT